MTDFNYFGDPEYIQIAARWVNDEERSSLPKRYGWSMGDLKITVAGHVLTRNNTNGDPVDYMSWYLMPLAEWLIQNWTHIFSTDDSKWSSPKIRSAAVDVSRDLERCLHLEDSADYDHVSEWWCSHALRSVDSSIPYPDVFFRRIVDHIEVSWLTDGDIGVTPSDYSVLLPVAEVENALMSFLIWLAASANVKHHEDIRVLHSLRDRLHKLAYRILT